MRKKEDTEANKKRFLLALGNNLGLILRAANKTKISSMTHYAWMANDPVYKKKVEDMIELKKDFVEHHLQNLVKKEESSCIQFAAKCLLRKRGYDQSTEIKNADDVPFKIELSSLDIDKTLKSIYSKADDDANGSERV